MPDVLSNFISDSKYDASNESFVSFIEPTKLYIILKNSYVGILFLMDGKIHQTSLRESLILYNGRQRFLKQSKEF